MYFLIIETSGKFISDKSDCFTSPFSFLVGDLSKKCNSFQTDPEIKYINFDDFK